MNNRIMGIIGSALLVIGIFLPIVSIMGLLTFSYFNFIQMAPGTFFTGILLLLIGLASLALTLTNRFKLLILTGILSLAILVLDFFRIRSGLSEAGSAAGERGGEIGARMAEAMSIGWGFWLMAIAAVILILAGVMKNTAPARAADWTGSAPPPPPPPPYNPGR
jgi:hypothetical protein